MVAAPGAKGSEGIIEAQQTGTNIMMGKWRWQGKKWEARRYIGTSAAMSGATNGSSSSAGASSTVSSKPTNPLLMFGQVFSGMLSELFGEKTPLDWGTSSSTSTSSTEGSGVSGGKLTGNTQARDLPIGKPKEFSAFLAPLAQQLYKTHNVLPSITIAQAAEETGWGKYAIGNNIFGVKAFSDWKGKKINARTHEFYGGTKSNVDAWFRDYDSIEECMNDRGKVMMQSNFAGVRNAKTYQEAAHALYKGHYATNPNYPSNIISIIKSNNLTKYDTKGNGYGFGDIATQGDAGATGMVNKDISSTNATRAATIARQVITNSYSASTSSSNASGMLMGILQILGTIAGYNSVIADNTGSMLASKNFVNNSMTNISNSNPVIVTNNGGGTVINKNQANEVNSQRERAEMIAKGIF